MNFQKICKNVLFVLVVYMVLATVVRVVVLGTYIFYPPIYGDEMVWQNVSTMPFSEYAQSHDNKSPVFLFILNILQMPYTIVITRIFNLLIYAFVTWFIYKQTERQEVLFIPLLALFSYPMILFDTAFEVLFVMLAMSYEKFSGIFIGLVAITRPVTMLYILLLRRTQQTIALSIGLITVLIMLATNGLFAYMTEVINYGASADTYIHENFVVVLFYIMLLLCLAVLSFDIHNKLWLYGIVASVPLLLRQYEHYFMPAIIIFFYLYLLKIKQEEECKNMLTVRTGNSAASLTHVPLARSAGVHANRNKNR